MANLTLVTPIPPQTVVPGEVFAVSMHVHDDGSNFNWSGFSPVGKITVGTTTITGAGSVTNGAGGTALVSWTALLTSSLPSNAWGTLIIYADPTSGSENRHIATIFIRTTAETIAQ